MMSPLKDRTRSLWFALILIAVAADSCLSYFSIQRITQFHTLVDHTNEVILTVQSVYDAVVQSESSVRGYIITFQDPYLETYRQGAAVLPDRLNHVQSLTNDNPEQVKNLEDLRAITVTRMATLKAGVDTAQTSGPAGITTLVKSGKGRNEMVDVREAVDKMINVEKTLLAARSHRADVFARTVGVMVFVASMGVLALLAWVYQLLKKEIQERAHASAQLEQRVVERTAQLQAVNQELEAFCYSVSHDLRAPLRGISGFSDVLLEDYADKLDAEGKSHLNRIVSASQKMGHLIDDLLNLSRVARGEIKHEVVNLSAIAGSVAEECRREYPGKTFDLVIQPDTKVSGDVNLIRIALTNLLQNAFKFSSRGDLPRVEFGRLEQATPAGETVYFVRDNGVGFDATYADKLFSPFQRLHKMEEFKGTGIGLAIVRRIVQRHGGRAWAESKQGEGAVFYFTLQPGRTAA